MANVVNIFHPGVSEKRMQVLGRTVMALIRNDRIHSISTALLGISGLLTFSVVMSQAFEIEQLREEVQQLKGDLKRHRTEGAR